MDWKYDDGGRAVAGYKGRTGDCTVRAIAIATGLAYAEVYDNLAERMAQLGHKRSARYGVLAKAYRPFLDSLGWQWTPTMFIGSGCKVHLRADELPSGRLIARLGHHVTAVIDGVVHDIFDPSREGTSCVYGYWTQS